LGAHNVLLTGQWHNGVRRFVGAVPATLPSYSRFDLSYSYDYSDLLGTQGGRITVGAINAFDQLATPYPTTNNGHNSYLEDPLGRTWYIRLTTSF
jgi:outer membrane receptor for ferrienterochelin and colicin